MQEFVWGICVEFRKTSTSTTKATSKSQKISGTEETYHFRSRTEIISCREGQRSAAATRQLVGELWDVLKLGRRGDKCPRTPDGSLAEAAAQLRPRMVVPQPVLWYGPA